MVFITFERMENAYKQRTYYHRAFYTLDCSDGIEQSVVFRSLTPEEIYERKLTPGAAACGDFVTPGQAGQAYLRTLHPWHQQS